MDSAQQGLLRRLRFQISCRQATPWCAQTLVLRAVLASMSCYERPQKVKSQGVLCSCPGARVHARDAHGRSALALAAAHCTCRTVERLLAAGADPATADVDGRTPLHYAVQKGAPPHRSPAECCRAMSFLDAARRSMRLWAGPGLFVMLPLSTALLSVQGRMT